MTFKCTATGTQNFNYCLCVKIQESNKLCAVKITHVLWVLSFSNQKKTVNDVLKYQQHVCDKIIRLFKLIRQQCTGTYLMNNEWVVSSVRRSHTIHHKYLYKYFTASFPFISEFSKFAPKFVIAPFFVYSFLIWYHSADNFNIFFFISNSRQV